MDYITHTRFKGMAICGQLNLPALTTLEEVDGMIYYHDMPVCLSKSENAHKHFARNDDNQGMERGRLTQAITKTLENNDDKYQERWDKVWEDAICQKYKRTEYADYWLWNHAFFNADIADLEHIYNLIKEV